MSSEKIGSNTSDSEVERPYFGQKRSLVREKQEVENKCTSPSGSGFYFLDIDGVLLYDLVS